MRVHGEHIIFRSTEIKQQADYRAYLPELRKDFKYLCGYCGKSEAVTKNTFEPDHFVPIKYAPNRDNDYTNLVYSCFVCNRKKSSKWPSGNADVQFVNGEGFVDPASEEYDTHLERDSSGNILGKTKAGKYMETKGFQFDKRPMKEIWKAMQLIEKKKKLQEKMKTISGDELEKYIFIDQMLEEIQEELFGAKE